MKHFLAILILAACAATGYGQTVKSLGYNTTNGQVVYSGTNTLKFTNTIAVSDTEITSAGLSWASVPKIDLEQTALVDENDTVVASWGTNGFSFAAPFVAEPLVYAQIRTNLGLGWSALANTNAATALLGYNETNGEVFYANTNVAYLYFTNSVSLANGAALFVTNVIEFNFPLWFGERVAGDNIFEFEVQADAAIARTNLGLPWTGLTNTNAATFQGALFSATNAAPTNTNAPTPDAWVDIQVGTNNYKLPLWQ